jgi:predicted Zn-dependent protease
MHPESRAILRTTPSNPERFALPPRGRSADTRGFVFLEQGRLRTILLVGLGLGLALATAPAAAQDDDWALTRKPAVTAPRSPTAGPDFALALRAIDRRAAIEQLIAAHRSRGGSPDELVREVEARANRSGESQRWLLLLAQIQRYQGAIDDARATFERANTLRPDAFSLRLSAELERDQNQLPRARELLKRALAARPSPSLRITLRSERLDVCAALGDRACAAEEFAALSSDRGGVAYALGYPRSLVQQHAYTEANAAYRTLLDREAAHLLDTRTRCDVHLELGELHLAQAALAEAQVQLEQARKICSDRSGEVLEHLLEVHRGQGSLAQFAQELAANPAPSAQQLAGRAFEELGQPAAAADAYRRALVRAPGDAQLADRLLSLLAREGRTTELIATYERLLNEPRTDPKLLTALTSLLRDLGRADEAVAAAARMGRARPSDVALHRLLVELYTRWELPDRAHAELEWLTRIDPDEPSHVLALAEAELAQGHESQAANVLRRLRRAAATPAQGHVQLGQAFADHELPREALAEFDAALRLEPQNHAAMRGRALALAHLYRHRDAEAEWQQLLMTAGADAERRRDAREQLVELWAELGELERHVRDYEDAFGYSAKSGAKAGADGIEERRDPEVGRLLAEGYLRLARQPSYRAQPARYLRGAEDVLGRVVSIDPSDAASWRALERLRARRGDREGAIAALEQLVRLEPKRAAEHYMRMAEYAHAAYRDAAAISYAERAAAVAPDDPQVHEWLGDVYRDRRDDFHTISHYQRALELDPARFAIALRLAELHAQRREVTAARRLLLTVLSSASEPALVLRAGRAAIQLAPTADARAELERQLLALVSNDPRRSEHRRLLIELYEMQLPELTAQQQPGSRVSLEAIRARAQKPLLDALGDDDATQVQSAVRLLRRLGTASAALPLMTLAEAGDADLAIRRSALAASCAVAGAELLPRQLVLASSRETRLRDMAAYCIARAPAPFAAPAVRRLTNSETPAVRALAMLGLGQLGAREQPTSAASLRLALVHDVSALVRSASAIALGLLSDRLARAPEPTAKATSEARALVRASLARSDGRPVTAPGRARLQIETRLQNALEAASKRAQMEGRASLTGSETSDGAPNDLRASGSRGETHARSPMDRAGTASAERRDGAPNDLRARGSRAETQERWRMDGRTPGTGAESSEGAQHGARARRASAAAQRHAPPNGSPTLRAAEASRDRAESRREPGAFSSRTPALEPERRELQTLPADRYATPVDSDTRTLDSAGRASGPSDFGRTPRPGELGVAGGSRATALRDGGHARAQDVGRDNTDRPRELDERAGYEQPTDDPPLTAGDGLLRADAADSTRKRQGSQEAPSSAPLTAADDVPTREPADQTPDRLAQDTKLNREALELALRGRDSAVAESAALGLGILADPAAATPLAQALFDPRSEIADAAELALRALSCDHPLTFEIAEPEPELTIDMLLQAARTTLSACRSNTFAPYFAEITEAARAALRGPPARRNLALLWLSRLAAEAAATGAAATTGAALLPSTPPSALVALPAEPDAGWRIELLSSLASDLSSLASHADPTVRRDVARIIEVIPVTAAETTLLALVTDPDLGVRGTALDALSRRKLPDRAAYCDRLAQVASTDRAFGMRRRAVRALGGMSGASATRVLVRVLAKDPFALVRESAADVLSSRDPNVVAPALLVAMRTDVEPRVRLAAARSLRQVGGALLHTAREDLRLDQGVREILQAR